MNNLEKLDAKVADKIVYDTQRVYHAETLEDAAFVLSGFGSFCDAVYSMEELTPEETLNLAIAKSAIMNASDKLIQVDGFIPVDNTWVNSKKILATFIDEDFSIHCPHHYIADVPNDKLHEVEAQVEIYHSNEDTEYITYLVFTDCADVSTVLKAALDFGLYSHNLPCGSVDGRLIF